MATIVKHLPSNKHYVLIGAGFGAYKSSRPTVFIANHVPKLDEGEITMAAVCDEIGKIKWVNSEEIEIIEVDGVSPNKLLNK